MATKTVRAVLTEAELATRLTAANAVLAIFAEKSTSIEVDGAYVHVRWTNYRGEEFRRRWMTRGQDWYPVWRREWPGGGTSQIALSQLVRWVRAKPVLPMPTWRYWGREGVYLFRDRAREVVAILEAADYPEATPCVLCGMPLTGSLDWWSLDGVTGPCCNMRSGCRQQREPNGGVR